MANEEQRLNDPFIDNFHHWRHFTDQRIAQVETQVNDLRVTVVKIEKDMNYNNELTQQIKKDTTDMVDISRGMRALGKILVGVVTIAAAIGAYSVISDVLHHNRNGNGSKIEMPR